MYEEHFGLQVKPFQLSPDAAFFYPSKEHKRALSFLEYGLSQADGFIVITGDVGTGKTTVLQTLLEGLDPRDLLVSTIVTSQLEGSDLLQLVAANFGLEIESTSKAILLRDLERFFVEQKQKDQRILLVVDEAQNLPGQTIEELRMLSNFVLDGEPLVQIFLLGQQEFRTTLLSEGFEQLRQRVIATYHLNPLDEDETRTYIEHRLTLAGWQNYPDISDEAFVAIFAKSDGVPRRINNLCDRILLYAFLEDEDHIDKAIVITVAEEIGAEFSAGSRMTPAPPLQAVPEPPQPKPEPPQARPELEAQQPPLETMARNMFDKANVQQRLAALERAVDGLGLSLKPEISRLQDEIVAMQLLLQAVLERFEILDDGDSKSGKSKTK
jgi:putative secretion ATPase (PEP-CTERM system associated)